MFVGGTKKADRIVDELFWRVKNSKFAHLLEGEILQKELNVIKTVVIYHSGKLAT